MLIVFFDCQPQNEPRATLSRPDQIRPSQFPPIKSKKAKPLNANTAQAEKSSSFMQISRQRYGNDSFVCLSHTYLYVCRYVCMYLYIV